MKIDGATLLTGIAGWPVAHSRSPLLHNYWFGLHAINGVYVPLPIAPGSFPKAIAGLQAAGFRGLNVTVPYKEAAAAIAHSCDDSVRKIGAANVLTFAPDGTIAAANTDSPGFLQSLITGAPNWTATAGPAVVLGAGGAARAVICALIDAGVETIRIVNRSRDRAAQVQAHFENGIEIYGWNEAPQALEDTALLVNTTSLGMQGQPSLTLSLDSLPQHAVVTDLVYAPLETALLQSARARGVVTVDGLGMLLYQAAAAFKIWFGVDPVVDDNLRRHVLVG